MGIWVYLYVVCIDKFSFSLCIVFKVGKCYCGYEYSIEYGY